MPALSGAGDIGEQKPRSNLHGASILEGAAEDKAHEGEEVKQDAEIDYDRGAVLQGRLL